MAIIHRAYTFDPVQFHTRLEERVIQHGQLALDALYNLVTTIVANASETTLKALEDMRFNSEWLDVSDEEVSRLPNWYMIVLAQALSPAPSLSNRLMSSYGVLERILPIVGWTDAEIRLLVQGNRLHTLVESSGNPLLRDKFYYGVDQFGGWLSLIDIESLLSRLLAIEERFMSPSPQLIGSLLDFAQWWSQSPIEMISKAYADAKEMLQTAVERSSALFMILD